MFTKAVRIALPVATALTGMLLVAYKAWLLDVTNDEAYSFYIVKHFWLSEALCTGNTHWLNSGAILLAGIFNATNPIALRWLSVLSYAVLLLIFIRQLRHFGLFVVMFLLVMAAFHPYVLDYFSMARGYAPGIALQAAALVWFYTRANSRAGSFLSLCTAAASVVANYSFIYFFVPFCMLYIYQNYLSNKDVLRSAIWLIADVLLMLVTIGGCIMNYRYIMHCSGDVTGAGSPQLSAALEWYWKGALYESVNYSRAVAKIYSMVMLTIFTASAFYGIMFRKKHGNRMFLNVSLICCGMLFMVIAVAVFLNGTFPAYRSALFFHIPFVMCFGFSVYYVFWKTGSSKGVLVAILGGIWLSGIICYHPKWVYDYPGTADASACFDSLQYMHARHVGLCPELYGSFRNYYSEASQNKYTFESEWLNANRASGWREQNRDLSRFDYIVVIPPLDLSYYNSQRSIKRVCSFSESKAIIYRVTPEHRGSAQ